MDNFNKNETQLAFNNLMKKAFHKYPTKFSKSNFSIPQNVLPQ